MSGSITSATIEEIFTKRQYPSKLMPTTFGFEHAKLKTIEDVSKIKPSIYNLKKTKSGLKHDVRMKVRKNDNHVTYSTEAPSVKGRVPKTSMKRYLAVKNKATNSLKLYEMNRVLVGAEVTFPKSTNMELNKSEMAKLSAQNEDNEKTYKSQIKTLVKGFGRLKGQRIFDQADRMKVDNFDVSRSINFATQNIDDKTLDVPKSAVTQLTPPVNKDASSIEQAYRLHDIITQAEIGLANEAVDQAIVGVYLNNPIKLSEDIANQKISAISGGIMARYFSKRKQDGYGPVMYLETMITLLHLRAKSLNAGPKAFDNALPFSLKEKIFNQFTEMKRIDTIARDRCICHVLVLALILNNYTLAYDDVMSSIKVGKDRLVKLVTVVGGFIRNNPGSSSKMLVLKLPLLSGTANNFISRKRKRN